MTKAKVTLRLDVDVLRAAERLAAEDGRSLAALLTERVEALIRDRRAYDFARGRALARLNRGFDLRWIRHRSRGEIHER
jgi:hypothetical protein